MTSRAKAGTRPKERLPARSKQAPVGPSRDEPISVELSRRQVDHIIKAATDANDIQTILFGCNGASSQPDIDSSSLDNARLSRSLLSGLLVLTAFPADQSFAGNADIAQQLGMTLTTTHRYISTLLAVGLLERDPHTRKYRRAR
jgi:IclR helix-turn-helix domain